MFTESVCARLVSNGGGEGLEMAVAAPDGQSRQGPSCCNCILSPTEGVKNPC